MYLAHIRYSEEITELKPLSEIRVEYVYRHGDTYQGYYKLDYSDFNSCGYAYPRWEIPEEEVPKDLIHIYTLYCKDAPILKRNGV